MQNIDPSILNSASQAWHEACSKLRVRVVAPFSLEKESASVTCVAYLPDFGGRNGMIIGGMDLPDILPNDLVKKLAKEKGLHFSFVNVRAFADKEVAEKVFKDALEDWGYFGTDDRRPAWLPK